MSYCNQEMDYSNEIERVPPPVTKEDFLTKLSDVDRANIEKVEELFQQALKEQDRTGALVVVGGILTKPQPRPDIDIAVILGDIGKDPTRDKYPTEISHALEDFKIFKAIIEVMISKDKSFEISNITEPFVDWEFGDPNLLRHEGSISIVSQKQGGTPLEFIRTSDRGDYRDILASGPKSRPYVLITKVT